MTDCICYVKNVEIYRFSVGNAVLGVPLELMYFTDSRKGCPYDLLLICAFMDTMIYPFVYQSSVTAYAVPR